MSPSSSTQLVVYQDGWSSDSQKASTICDVFQTPPSPQINRIVQGDVFGALLTSWGSNLLSTSLLGHLRSRPQNSSAFTIAINVIKAQFILFRRRIDALEVENDDLKHANMMYHSDVGGLESELANLRADYYSELFQRRLDTRNAKEDKEEIHTLKAELMAQKTEVMILKDKNAQYDSFIQALVDLKLHDSVFQAAYQSVKDGCDAEDALIDSVIRASTQKGSAWSRIVPAIVGPRCPEHYLSAIDLALKARKDLHERQKASGFWKLKAMVVPSNANVVTPSSSQISDICDQLIQRQVGPMESEYLALRDIGTPDQELAVVSDVAPPSRRKLAHIQETSTTSEPSRLHTLLIDDASINFKDTLAISNSLESVPEEDVGEAYLSSGRESVVSVETVKAMHPTQTESVGDKVLDAFVHVHENTNTGQRPARNEDGWLPIQESVKRVSTPSKDEICFDLEPSTPTKSFGTSNLSPTIFMPTPLRIKSRPRQPVSPNLSAPTTFLSKSRVIEPHTISRSNPELFVAPVKSLGPISPNRARMTTPGSQTSKRPVLQSINLNVPSAACGDKDNRDINGEVEAESSQNLRRSSARDFRKRRGVIMVERVDVDPIAVVTDESFARPKKSCSDLPERPSRVSEDVFSAPPSQNTKSLKHHIVEKDEGIRGRDGADQPDDVRLSPANQAALIPPSQSRDVISSSKMSTGLLQPSEIEVRCATIPSPTSLIVSRLIENFSDSDLGSLEMTEDEDSDSDCEHIRRVQNELDDLPIDLSNLPHIRRASAQEAARTKAARCSREERGVSHPKDDDDDDYGLSTAVSTTAVVSGLAPSVVASPSAVSASRSSRPATPFSKSLSWTSSRKDDVALSASTSDSSYATSSGSGSDSQPSKRTSKLPLFGLARRFGRGSTSPTPTLQTNKSSIPPPHIRTPSPTSPPEENKKTPISSTSTSSTPRSASYKPLNNLWNLRNSSSKTTMVTPTKTVSSPKPLSKPDSTTQQRTPPITIPKPSAGQSFIRRLSNVPIPKPKSIPQPTKTSPAYLTPPSPGQHTKPRSHTINTASPLPPALSTPSPQSLAGSTKPRSHTVNTYSPTTRSPLSRLAGGVSPDDKSTPTKASRASPGPSPQRSLALKSASSTKTNGKSTTLPLRVKKSSSKNQSLSQDSDSKPPTAAFMRPAATATSSTRRMSNSIAPLIPNWTPSATNSALTPKQCRSMFRNSLSMVVR